jgi:hypothetical protein
MAVPRGTAGAAFQIFECRISAADFSQGKKRPSADQAVRTPRKFCPANFIPLGQYIEWFIKPSSSETVSTNAR